MRNANDRRPALDLQDPDLQPKRSKAADADRVGVVALSNPDDPILAMTGDAHLLGLDQLVPPAPPNRKQWASLGIFVLLSVAMVATALVITATSEKKASTLASEQARLEQSVRGKSELLRIWIESRLLAARRLTESRLVRLFVSDVALNPQGSPLPRSLLDQRPYFQALMADFIKQNELVRAAVLDKQGRFLLSSPGPTINVAEILKHVNEKPVGWKHIVSPIRSIDQMGKNFVIDLLVPFPKVQASDDDGESESLLALTFPANKILTDILTLPAARASAESLHLIQERRDLSERISLVETELRTAILPQGDELIPGQRLGFGRRSIADDQAFYSLGEPIPGVGWTVVHDVTPEAALAPVSRFVIIASAIASIIVLTFSFCFAVLWWRRASTHHQELVSLYQSLAERLDKQRQFLSAITSSISDWLTVSSEDDRYIYANPSFSTALGRPASEILGRFQHDVLPLKAFTSADDDFDGLIAGEQVGIVDIGDRRHIVATASSPLRDQLGNAIGTVTVTRDQTDLVEQRRRRVLALTETIDALVHTIERRDPFLLGHTRRLRSYALAVGRRIGLSDDHLTGLALAASLSQIGKIFIPDMILVKPERHDPREAQVMRSHIDHAISILGRIDFAFPVVEILSQMHERLDGSGYPNGLSDAEIGLPGRILGVTDVFCARTAPRSYRDRLSAGNALYQLANNATRYDIQVIASLAKVVTQKGELDPADDHEIGFLDARIWQKVRRQDNEKMDTAA